MTDFFSALQLSVFTACATTQVANAFDLNWSQLELLKSGMVMLYTPECLSKPMKIAMAGLCIGNSVLIKNNKISHVFTDDVIRKANSITFGLIVLDALWIQPMVTPFRNAVLNAVFKIC